MIVLGDAFSLQLLLCHVSNMQLNVSMDHTVTEYSLMLHYMYHKYGLHVTGIKFYIQKMQQISTNMCFIPKNR